LLSLFILLSFFFLLTSFFLNTSKQALYRLGETFSKDLLEESKFFYLPFHRTLFSKKSFELLLFSINVADQIAKLGYLIVVFLALLAFPLFIWHIAIGLVVALIVLFLVSDLISLILSIRWPEPAFKFTAPYTSFFLFLIFPLSFFFIKLADLSLRKAVKIEPLEDLRETIVDIIHSGDITEKLNQSDKKLIESVIQFKDLIVREAMIPRVNLFCLPANISIRQAARALGKEGYSRVPVYRGTIDNIIGMLMYKDILEIYMECEAEKKPWDYLDTAIETVAKSVFYTPETNKVSHLLQEFRNKQMHMAIVVDEYGGTAGVVTIEDLLEEIVGDISDEYDVAEEVLYTPQPGGGSWIVDARMYTKDAEDLFAIEIPQEGDYETIGGYLFHKLGSIPEKGMILNHETFDLEILSSSERSVDKVRITPKRSTDISEST
jgi:putative hemolysin